MIFLETDRLLLKPLETEHINTVYMSWLNNAEVCQYNGHHYYPYTRKMAEEYVTFVNGNRDVIVFTVHLRESNKHIGNVSIADIDYINRSASINILLGDREEWGKGYGYEALKAIMEHAFLELNLNRVSCGTSEKNIGMQRVAEKLNMEKEGIKRSAMYKNGEYIDLFEYSVLRKEFIVK